MGKYRIITFGDINCFEAFGAFNRVSAFNASIIRKDFVVSHIKIVKTGSKKMVASCRDFFGIELYPKLFP